MLYDKLEYYRRMMFLYIVKMIGHRNINHNSILISLYTFSLAELYRYLCYGGQSLLIPLYVNNTLNSLYVENVITHKLMI